MVAGFNADRSRERSADRGRRGYVSAGPGSMASLTPALIMAIGAVVAALVVIATASVLGHQDLARPVFGGMIAASVLGIFVIPMLYVVFQWLRERTARRAVASEVQGDRG